MWESILTFVKSYSRILISTVIVIAIAVVLNTINNIVTRRFVKKNLEKRKHAVTMAKLLKSIIKYAILILSSIIILDIWGINIGPVLAGAGILGLVIGLGAQSLINDFLSGFAIIFENHYDVGDVVEIDGFKGTVLEVSLKSTKIISWLNEVKIIANGNIKSVINFSKEPTVSYIDIRIGYEEDVNKVINLLEEKLVTIKDYFPQVIEGPNVIGVSELANQGMIITITLKTIANEQYSVKRAINKFVKEIFDENNIKIAYDQVVVHNDKNNN